MAKAKQEKTAFPRLLWTRSPVQRAHSSPKGAKGYNRRKAKRELRKLIAD